MEGEGDERGKWRGEREEKGREKKRDAGLGNFVKKERRESGYGEVEKRKREGEVEGGR